jgi:predicted metalloendopeptidase
MNVPGNFGRRVKCPCCANPWDQTGDDSNSTSVDNMLCTPCLSDSKGVSGIDPENFDLTVSPRENFYLFSNGGWRAKNPIPNEYSSWNTFIALRDLNLDRLKVILEELESSSAGAEVSDDHAKLADFYNSFMDEKAIETASAANLKDVMATCLGSTADPTAALATLHSKYGIRGLFAMYSSPDKKNSKHSLCTITQSGLGMPDRDYYFDADKKEKRTKYHEYVTTMFTLLGTVGGVSAYSDAAECVIAAGEFVVTINILLRQFYCFDVSYRV